MKRALFTILAAATVLTSCIKENALVGDPYFAITDSNGDPVLMYGENRQYQIDLEYFEYYATAGTEILLADTYTISSNCSWRFVPAGDDQDWVRSFPDKGKNEGNLMFLVERNNDQTSSRMAAYSVVINDGEKDIPVGGTIIINQSAAVDFMKFSAAAISIDKGGASKEKFTVTTNLDWTYTIEPDATYATENVDWITDVTPEGTGSGTGSVVLTYADNSEGTIRGAILTINASNPEFSKVINITQFGQDVEVVGYPVIWTVKLKENNYATTWPANGYAEATTGSGRVSFNLDSSKSFGYASYLDLANDYSPRATTYWPGDYMQIEGDAPVAGGALMNIKFQTRVSSAGHKYWRLQYLDGSEWKIAGKSFVNNDVLDLEGKPVVYTHEMLPGGNTNIDVNTTVKYTNTTSSCKFRFICAANFTCSDTILEKANACTWRLTTSTEAVQPQINCVAAGTESLVEAVIDIKGVTDNIITFEGTPAGPANFTVESDTDFTVEPSASWLHVNNAAGFADEPLAVALTCDPNDQNNLRRATVEIIAGITKRTIQVIQSSAGQDLAPFIAIVGGNKCDATYNDQTLGVKVQSNIPVECEVLSDGNGWMSYTATKALVTTDEFPITLTFNDSGLERTGTVRFFNTENGIETKLTVTQATFAKSPILAKWVLNKEEATTAFTAEFKDVDSPHFNVGFGKNASGTDCQMTATQGVGTIKFWQGDKSGVPGFKGLTKIFEKAVPKVTGALKGDYWLFSATAGWTLAAGTQIKVTYSSQCSSNNPARDWNFEFFEDGEWKSASSSLNEFGFNYASAKDRQDISVTFTLGKASKDIQFRMVCMGTVAISGTDYSQEGTSMSGNMRLSGYGSADVGDITMTIIE